MSDPANDHSELMERLNEVVRVTGCTPEDLESAAHELAAHERWKAAKIDEALAHEATDPQSHDVEDVFAEMDAILEDRLGTDR